MPAALAFAMQALTLLPGLIQAGADVLALIQSTTTAMQAMHAEGRDPTQAEWDALKAASEAALARLDKASA